MKLIQITLILLVAVSIFLFITSGRIFHLSKLLPFCSGSGIDWPYEIGSLFMVGLFLWGLHRLKKRNQE